MKIRTEKELWRWIKEKYPYVHWQRIETALTAAGVPDINGCHKGVEIWIESKVIRGNKVDIKPRQTLWLRARATAGGRTYILAIQPKSQNIHVWHGSDAAIVREKGILYPALRIGNTEGPDSLNDLIFSDIFGHHIRPIADHKDIT
jgi:Holliday junction resolvase